MPMSERERQCEVMFEQIGVRRWFLARQATLSLYTAGRTTGGCEPIPFPMQFTRFSWRRYEKFPHFTM